MDLMKNKYSSTNIKNPYSKHRLIIDSIGKSQTILDIGCNDGTIGRYGDKSNIYYGIDINEKALEVAKRDYFDVSNIDLNETTLLPWNVHFDTIIFADVLEHLLEPENVFKTLVDKYAKPTSRIIVSLPNVANWTIRLQLLFGRFNYQDKGILDKSHLHLYTFRTARELVKKTDLQLLKETGSSGTFGFFIRTLPFTRSLLSYSIILELEKKS